MSKDRYTVEVRVVRSEYDAQGSWMRDRVIWKTTSLGFGTQDEAENLAREAMVVILHPPKE